MLVWLVSTAAPIISAPKETQSWVIPAEQMKSLCVKLRSTAAITAATKYTPNHPLENTSL